MAGKHLVAEAAKAKSAEQRKKIAGLTAGVFLRNATIHAVSIFSFIVSDDVSIRFSFARRRRGCYSVCQINVFSPPQ
jgi:hypothetical protein